MGIIIQCKDDGPLVEWGDSSTSTNEGDGAGTGFDGGFVDVNTCKLDELLDVIADFWRDITGGGEDETPPPEGGDPPPEGGDETPPEDGEETPPEDGDETPPEGGGDGDGGEQSGLDIDVSGTTLTYFKAYEPILLADRHFAVVPGTYRRAGDAVRLTVRRIRRPSPTAGRR